MSLPSSLLAFTLSLVHKLTIFQENELQVGPYMSTILATPRIAYGKGQCGQCYAEKKVQIQADVKLCQNYIACDNET